MFSTEKLNVLLLAFKTQVSSEASAANAQQLPESCWFLTSVTKPFSAKLYLAGNVPLNNDL